MRCIRLREKIFNRMYFSGKELTITIITVMPAINFSVYSTQYKLWTYIRAPAVYKYIHRTM